MNRQTIERFRRHPIAIYLVLAYGITWILWVPSMIIATRQGYLLPTIDNIPLLVQNGFADARHLVVSVAFSLAVYGPLVGALVSTSLDGGKVGINELWARMKKWKIGIRWYLTAFSIALLLAFVPAGLAMFTGISRQANNSLLAFIPYILPLFLMQLLTSGLGEEPGWRGFLLPKQKSRSGGDRYIWANGLNWAIWHYPITAYSILMVMVDVPPAAMVATVIFGLAGNTMSLIGLTYLYTWLYNNTQSVFLVMVFHAATNVANAAALPLLGGPQFIVVVGIMPWVLVFIMKRALGKQRFPGNGPEAV